MVPALVPKGLLWGDVLFVFWSGNFQLSAVQKETPGQELAGEARREELRTSGESSGASSGDTSLRGDRSLYGDHIGKREG